MDPDLVRFVLIVLGVLLVVGIYLWDRYKHARPRSRPKRRRRSPVEMPIADDPADTSPRPDAVAVAPDPLHESVTTEPEDRDEPRSRQPEPVIDPEPAAIDDWTVSADNDNDPQFSMDLSFDAEGRSDYLSSSPDIAEDIERLIVVVNVIGTRGPIGGGALQRACASAGLKPGEMSIYHRHDPAAGGVLFSMASMVEPGVFPFDDMDSFTTPGVSLFTQLPGVRDGAEIYESMLDTAKKLAAELGAELQDDRHNKLTRQMQEHTRERIIEHRRRLRLARSRH